MRQTTVTDGVSVLLVCSAVPTQQFWAPKIGRQLTDFMYQATNELSVQLFISYTYDHLNKIKIIYVRLKFSVLKLSLGS